MRTLAEWKVGKHTTPSGDVQLKLKIANRASIVRLARELVRVAAREDDEREQEELRRRLAESGPSNASFTFRTKRPVQSWWLQVVAGARDQRFSGGAQFEVSAWSEAHFFAWWRRV